jgi:hypothetical protein
MTAQAFEISSLEDLERVTASVGLVGPRAGADKRTKEQMEWYVLRRFLEKAIPTGIFGLPLAIRRGCPPKEPDFVLMHGGTTNATGLVEITEATDEADQREMTASEQSGKATLLGGFGGRFSGGASWSGFVWASDIIKGHQAEKRSSKVHQPLDTFLSIRTPTLPFCCSMKKTRVRQSATSTKRLLRRQSHSPKRQTGA